MKVIQKISELLWGSILVLCFSPAYGLKKITTITTPDVLYQRQPMPSFRVQEPLDFKTNTVAALTATTQLFTELFKHFSLVLGFLIIVASLFQYAKHRKNPHVMRLSYVGTTFFCGLVMLGLGLLTNKMTAV